MVQIAYVNLFVSDLGKAIDFYETKLGFALQHSDAEHGYASFAAGAVTLGAAVAGDDQQALVGRHTGIGLAVDDLESEYARLVDAGVTFDMPPTRQPWGGFMAMICDPDGNILYLDEVSAAHG
jgi:predicted enzyme related to lactoylglutathione lyase